MRRPHRATRERPSFGAAAVLSSCAGAALGLVLAASCVLGGTIVPAECGDPGTHSVIDGEECYCAPAYDWCRPDDLEDHTCCRVYACGVDGSNSAEIAPGECGCARGYDWCNPTDEDDFACCPLDGAEASTGDDPPSTGSGTGSSTGSGTGSETGPRRPATSGGGAPSTTDMSSTTDRASSATQGGESDGTTTS